MILGNRCLSMRFFQIEVVYALRRLKHRVWSVLVLVLVVFLSILCAPASILAEQAIVPSVVGDTKSEARIKLKRAGLLYEFEDFRGCPRQQGIVTFQNPEKDKKVNLPFEVYMKTNSWELLDVPAIENRSHSQYANFLGEIGIKSRVETQYVPIRGPCPLVRETVETFIGTRPEPGGAICENETLVILVERREFGLACHGNQTRNGCICF